MGGVSLAEDEDFKGRVGGGLDSGGGVSAVRRGSGRHLGHGRGDGRGRLILARRVPVQDEVRHGVADQRDPDVMLMGGLDDLSGIPARAGRQVDRLHLTAAVMGEHDPAR